MLENLVPETRSPCSALNFECEAWKDIAVRKPMEDASAAMASTTSLNTSGQSVTPGGIRDYYLESSDSHSSVGAWPPYTDRAASFHTLLRQVETQAWTAQHGSPTRYRLHAYHSALTPAESRVPVSWSDPAIPLPPLVSLYPCPAPATMLSIISQYF